MMPFERVGHLFVGGKEKPEPWCTIQLSREMDRQDQKVKKTPMKQLAGMVFLYQSGIPFSAIANENFTAVYFTKDPHTFYENNDSGAIESRRSKRTTG